MIKLAGIVLREKVEFVGDGEDEVKVGSRQQLLFPGSEPALARLSLALGAGSVSAGVIGDGLMSALWTSIAMTAPRCGNFGERETPSVAES
jgi:hypothetical protein